MKDIIQLKKRTQFLNFQLKKMTFEEYGLLMCLKDSSDGISFRDVQTKFKTSVENIIEIIKKLISDGIIDLEIETTGDQNLWIIEILENQVGSTASIVEKDLLVKVFGITEDQSLEIRKITDLKLALIQLINIIDFGFEDLIKTEEIIINNENDYVKYLEDNSPLTILINLEIKISTKILEYIFTKIYVEQKNCGLINYLIEFSVKNSKYENFSIEYADAILKNWEKNQLNSASKVLEFVRKNKENKLKGKYSEPKWDQEVSANKNEEQLGNKIDDLLLEKGLS